MACKFHPKMARIHRNPLLFWHSDPVPTTPRTTKMKTRSLTAKENGASPQPQYMRRHRSRAPDIAPKAAKDRDTSRKPGQPTPLRLRRAASAPNVDESPGDDAAKMEADGNPRDEVSITLKDGEPDGETNSDAATNVPRSTIDPHTSLVPPGGCTFHTLDLVSAYYQGSIDPWPRAGLVPRGGCTLCCAQLRQIHWGAWLLPSARSRFGMLSIEYPMPGYHNFPALSMPSIYSQLIQRDTGGQSRNLKQTEIVRDSVPSQIFDTHEPDECLAQIEVDPRFNVYACTC
ncbi:hypothetical protein BDN72DRAFT_865193 [Pluteus cervinus]|uniref:Uncharacterized protein n=1 Tax=Pluteus cervinus TaxID=181527 RepID=A0ACD3A127_9AGAR|nr:hypothetical protein BDN72DRAFT_865193 [Pluteus cervinus]